MPRKSKETLPQAAAGGEQFVKVAQADDANPDARQPSPEEMEAMLQGKNRTHFEGLGDAWAVLTGQNPAAIMPQVVGTVLHEGGTRPAWQWKRGGRDHVLMAWPKDPWESGLGANVAVSMIEGKNPMWFFDPLYGRDRDDLTPGVTHTFLLAGLAYGLRKALLDEVTITQGPRFEAYAEAWLAENPGRSRLDVPPLKVEVAGRHLIMPGRRFCEYQLRAVIEDVQDCQLEKMPLKLLYLSFPFETREPMRLALYVSRMALGDFEPEKGQEVDAYVWLQARIIDIDQGQQQ